jgi:hypothetical protein
MDAALSNTSFSARAIAAPSPSRNLRNSSNAGCAEASRRRVSGRSLPKNSAPAGVTNDSLSRIPRSASSGTSVKIRSAISLSSSVPRAIARRNSNPGSDASSFGWMAIPVMFHAAESANRDDFIKTATSVPVATCRSTNHQTCAARVAS